MKKSLITSLLLLATSALHAEGDGKWQSPAHVDGAQTVSIAQARELHADGVPFVDVRNPRLYAKKHIPGAIHLDLKDGYNKDALLKHVSKDQAVVLYCSGVKCSRSSKASRQAVEWGYTQVKYFRAGVVGWKQAGLPMTWADGTTRPDPKYAK